MMIGVLVVDDETDVEVLFSGNCLMDFGLVTRLALTELAEWVGERDQSAAVGHQRAGRERLRSAAGGKGAAD